MGTHFIRFYLSSTNPSLSSLGVKSHLHFIMYAAVMELVDLVDSKSSAFGRVGSNPTCGTTNLFNTPYIFKQDRIKNIFPP